MIEDIDKTWDAEKESLHDHRMREIEKQTPNWPPKPVVLEPSEPQQIDDVIEIEDVE